MAIIFILLFLLYNIALVIGFFRPEWVLYRINVKKTSSRVLMIYGSLSLLTFLVFITVFQYGEVNRNFVSSKDIDEIEESAKLLPGREYQINTEDSSATLSKKTIVDKDKEDSKEPELPSSKKQEIISELKKLDRKARAEARKRYPSGPEDLSAGDNFILLKETKFFPATDKSETVNGSGKTIKLYPGSWINIIDKGNGKDVDTLIVEAYAPDGRSYGSGKVQVSEIENQWGSKKLDIELQQELTSELKNQYRTKILKKYDITEEQLKSIESEK